MNCDNYDICHNEAYGKDMLCLACRSRVWNGEFLECERKAIERLVKPRI